MARLVGVNLPNKPISIALTYIFGIGRTSASQICAKASVAGEVRANDLADNELGRIREIIDRDYKIEGDLRREVNQNIRRLIEIGSYRGLRHRSNLPVSGQRTRTNARTRKGARRTVAGRGRRTGGKK